MAEEELKRGPDSEWRRDDLLQQIADAKAAEIALEREVGCPLCPGDCMQAEVLGSILGVKVQ